MSSKLTPNRTHELLQTNLPFFAKHSLVIKDKQTRKLVPFIFNKAQEYTHKRLEEQMEHLGWVRALILKGRKQGESTYVGGRFYHKVTRNKGRIAFIISHEFKSAGTLFDMVDRYQKNCPEAVKASVGVDNSKQLKFDVLESEYAVGTAGNEDIGRGGDPDYLHGSEVAFWKNTDSIETGVMQSVPDAPGTEIILESTANGVGNMFHQKCILALADDKRDWADRKGDYILIFIPWYWQIEYRRAVPENFECDEKELILQELFGIDDEQIYWRRKKIENLGSLWKFKQEYPFTVKEAFVSSGNSLIKIETITQARKLNIAENKAPLILGVDMGRTGDPVVISPRRGRQLFKSTRIEPAEMGIVRQTHVAGVLIRMIQRLGVDKIFIDYGLGYGTVDNLVENGYEDIVQGVYFNEGACNSDIHANKRTEMHIEARDWFHDGNVSIPDDEELEVIFGAIPDVESTGNGLNKMKPKKEIKKDLGSLISLDEWDSFILTFAYPVATTLVNRSNRIKKVERTSSLKTMQRVNKSKTSANLTSNLSIWS